jgi:hypothetical protein
LVLLEETMKDVPLPPTVPLKRASDNTGAKTVKELPALLLSS